MRKHMIHASALAASTIALCWLTVGPASAVTPQQCEQETTGHVRAHIDPTNSAKAICTCEGGFYDGQEVFGAHIVKVDKTPVPVTCVGLGLGA